MHEVCAALYDPGVHQRFGQVGDEVDDGAHPGALAARSGALAVVGLRARDLAAGELAVEVV